MGGMYHHDSCKVGRDKITGSWRGMWLCLAVSVVTWLFTCLCQLTHNRNCVHVHVHVHACNNFVHKIVHVHTTILSVWSC